MNSLLETIDPQTVLLVSAIVVSLLLLKLLFRVLSVSLRPIFAKVKSRQIIADFQGKTLTSDELIMAREDC